jgi:hypothetical protein
MKPRSLRAHGCTRIMLEVKGAGPNLITGHWSLTTTYEWAWYNFPQRHEVIPGLECLKMLEHPKAHPWA